MASNHPLLRVEDCVVVSPMMTTKLGNVKIVERFHIDNENNHCTAGLVVKGSMYCEMMHEQQQHQETNNYLFIRLGSLKTGKILSTSRSLGKFSLTGLGLFPEGAKLIQVTNDLEKNNNNETVAMVYFKTQRNEIYHYPCLFQKFGRLTGICYFELRQYIVTNGSLLIKLDEEPQLWDAENCEIVPVKMRTKDSGEDLQSVSNLSELEWDVETNTILAAISTGQEEGREIKNALLRIDPETGFVTHRYELSLDVPSEINGISTSGTRGKVWIKGQGWPHIYAVQLEDDGIGYICYQWNAAQEKEDESRTAETDMPPPPFPELWFEHSNEELYDTLLSY